MSRESRVESQIYKKIKLMNMTSIKKFEDINAWQRARELTNDIYQVTDKSEFSNDFTLRNQIKKASTSIMLNIAEGFARKTDKEFNQFLAYAHGSCAEVQSALYVALDQNYISQETFDKLYTKTEEVSKMIMNFSNYLSKNLNKKNF